MTKHHLIACPVFARELAAVLAETAARPIVHLMDYTIHSNAMTMAAELAKGVAKARTGGTAISFLVGRECQAHQPIGQLAAACGAKLPAGHNCLEIILGRERARVLQENRTTLMTPAWITMINNAIADGHWTVEDARINLGRYERILMLDPGLEPLTDHLLLEFFDLTRVPIEILPVNLDHFKKVVHRLLADP
jgi:hypothetical protein